MPLAMALSISEFTFLNKEPYMQRGVEEDKNSVFEFNKIIAASDILQLYKGIDEVTLARIIDNAICISTKFDGIEKKYRRFQSNDFGFPIPYYLIETKDGKYLCKKIFIPSPYSISSHGSFELSIDFSGIIFEAKEIKSFLDSDYFKKYHENNTFYSILLKKIINTDSQSKNTDTIIITEVLQELRLLRFLNEQMKYFYMDQYSDYRDNFDAQYQNARLRDDIESYKNGTERLKPVWDQSVAHVVEYAYALGNKGKKAHSKEQTFDELIKKGMSRWVFESFWRGLPAEAKQHAGNTPKKLKK